MDSNIEILEHLGIRMSPDYNMQLKSLNEEYTHRLLVQQQVRLDLEEILPVHP